MPSISISLLSNVAKVGDRVFVGISVDSGGKIVDGLDVFLNTTPKLIPTAYIGTKAMPVHNVVKLDSTKVIFSQLNPGVRLPLKAHVATIEYKAVSPGTFDIKFDYTPGSTLDTNVASNGVDILTSAVSKNFTIIA